MDISMDQAKIEIAPNMERSESETVQINLEMSDSAIVQLDMKMPGSNEVRTDLEIPGFKAVQPDMVIPRPATAETNLEMPIVRTAPMSGMTMTQELGSKMLIGASTFSGDKRAKLLDLSVKSTPVSREELPSTSQSSTVDGFINLHKETYLKRQKSQNQTGREAKPQPEKDSERGSGYASSCFNPSTERGYRALGQVDDHDYAASNAEQETFCFNRFGGSVTARTDTAGSSNVEVKDIHSYKTTPSCSVEVIPNCSYEVTPSCEDSSFTSEATPGSLPYPPKAGNKRNAVNPKTKLRKRNRGHGKSPYSVSIGDRKKQPSGMSSDLWKQVKSGPVYEMTVCNRRREKSCTVQLTHERALDMLEDAADNIDEDKQIFLNLVGADNIDEDKQIFLNVVHLEETFVASGCKNEESYQTKARYVSIGLQHPNIEWSNVRKLLDLKYSEWRKFFHMVQLHFKLFHPNIVKISHIYIDIKSLTLYPSYCGPSIYEIICARGETFGDQFLINLIRTLFSVLEFIHNKGFIHQNIRPTNICLDDNGNLFLVGFDFCINLKDSNINMLETDNDRSIDDSPEYFSPELCQQIVNADDKRCGFKPRYKDVQISGKSDTYAVGQMISFIFMKKELLEPYYLNPEETKESYKKFILEIAKDPGFMKSCRPDDMPQDWKNVADQCLEGDASKRYDVSKVIELLNEMEKNRTVGNKPVAMECKLEKQKEKIQQKSDTAQSATQQEHNLLNLSNTGQINPQDGEEHLKDPGIQKFSSASVRFFAESLHGDITNHTLGRPPPESNNIPEATVLPLPSTEDVAASGLEPVFASDDDIPIRRIPTTVYDMI